MAKLTRAQRRYQTRTMPAGVGEPRFPAEVMLKVIDHLVQANSTDQAVQATYDNLLPLCLVSKWFHQVVFPLVYGHVHLPTEARAELFVRTVSAIEWKGRLWRGELEGAVQSVSMVRNVFTIYMISGSDLDAGTKVYQAKHVDDNRVMDSISARIDSTGLSSLKLSHAWLDLQRLNRLRSLSRLSLCGVQLCLPSPAVEWSLCLPNLTHLVLDGIDGVTDTRPTSSRGDLPRLLCPEVLPHLTHLTAIRHPGTSDHRATNSAGPAFAALLGQLTFLEIEDDPRWLTHDSAAFWSSLTSLKHLVLSGQFYFLADLPLGDVPSALATLDLSAIDRSPYRLIRLVGQTAPHLPHLRHPPHPPSLSHRDLEWDKEWTSVSHLRRLILPAKQTWQSEDADERPARWLGQVEAAARAQGAKVEFK